MSPAVSLCLDITYWMMLIAVFFSLIRLVIGPTLPDRVVALDLIAVLTVGIIGLVSISTEETAFLDVGIALALVSFLGTIAFARYVEETEVKTDEELEEPHHDS
jgi:multicomponent Na+:H+ antiporter subunit F